MPNFVDINNIAIPSTIYAGKKTVTTAGTDEVLASSQALISGVTVKALASNSGLVFVGPEGVASTTGFQLSAGEQVFIEVGNLATVWLDVATNGEGVTYVAS